MPGKREQPFGLHCLHHRRPLDVFVTGMGNLTTRDLPWYKRAIQFHAKPLAKLAMVRQRTPDARNRRLEFNALLNTVAHFMQPPGCILRLPASKGQPRGCVLRRDGGSPSEEVFPLDRVVPAGHRPISARGSISKRASEAFQGSG